MNALTDKQKAILEAFRIECVTPNRCRAVLRLVVSGLDLSLEKKCFSPQDVASMILSANKYVANVEKGV